MKKQINFQKEIPLEDTVSSITSISLECNFSEEERVLQGTFLVEGSYKTHELSINKKDFHYDLPFSCELENAISNTANVEITDFTYELNDNSLFVDIDYELSYDEEEIKDEFDEDEFREFMKNHEVDLVSFEEDCKEEDTPEEEITEEEEEIVESEENLEENSSDERNVTILPAVDDSSVEETLLNNINKEEKYITYHVYVCEENDTLESICEKFNISKEEIRDYNNFDEVKFGIKLIIPVKDE